MSAALHKQTYTGLKPSGSFINIKTAKIGGVSGFGSDSAGFPRHASIRRDTPGGTKKGAMWLKRLFLLPWDNHFEVPIAWKSHHTSRLSLFFLIKNINISGVQKYHRWFVTNSKRKYLARSGHGIFPQMVGIDGRWRTSLCWGLMGGCATLGWALQAVNRCLVVGGGEDGALTFLGRKRRVCSLVDCVCPGGTLTQWRLSLFRKRVLAHSPNQQPANEGRRLWSTTATISQHQSSLSPSSPVFWMVPLHFGLKIPPPLCIFWLVARARLPSPSAPLQAPATRFGRGWVRCTHWSYCLDWGEEPRLQGGRGRLTGPVQVWWD